MRIAGPLVAVVLLAGACSGSGSTKESGSKEINKSSATTAPALSVDTAALAKMAEAPKGCELLDSVNCLLPFPSDTYTVEANTPTGRRLALPAAGMPSNSKGAAIDPAPWNQLDGFSPGTPILAYFPDLDTTATGLPTERTIERSTELDSPSVLMDLTDGTRIPHWVELDQQATDSADQLTIMRPAISLPEGHTFAVAYRRLVNKAGRTIQPSPMFATVASTAEIPIEDPDGRIGAERTALAPVIDALDRAGVGIDSLTLAWSFTVASADSTAGSLLAMRNDMITRIGFASPIYNVVSVVENPADLPDGIGRIVKGKIEVPLYLSGKGEPGAHMNVDAKGKPKFRGFNVAVDYTCMLTARQLGQKGSVELALPVLYGHGLLGSRSEVERADLAKDAVAGNFMHCATDWLGMSEADVGTAIGALSDLNKFPAMVDRMEQGMIAQLVLAKAMIHPNGLSANPAFSPCNGPPNAFCAQPQVPTVKTDEVFYDGNSQGGIMGIALTAVSTDFTKATLGVPGMNYSTLLNRSVDWETYRKVFEPAYPDPIVRQILFGVMQMLWDRGEGNGYVQHLTDNPYDGTPKHQVILEVAVGDHQVSPLTASIAARTLDIPYHDPALGSGRDPGFVSLTGLEPIETYPAAGSALMFWDSGAMLPPLGNISVTASPDWPAKCGDSGSENDTALCADPHEDPRDQPGFWDQKKAFYESGVIIDPCGGEACKSVPEK